MLQKCNDSELLVLWKRGSKAAFTFLFDRYFNKLLQFRRKKVNDQELAEELVMDVLLRLWRRQDDLEMVNTLSPYLFHSVRMSSL